MLAQSPDSLYFVIVPTVLSQPPAYVRTKPVVSFHHMTLPPLTVCAISYCLALAVGKT